jgi:asparagine synthase (glutamine-hydrolysing)
LCVNGENMCGIAGILSLTNRPINAQKIKGMCDIMAHRGPDDRGYVFINHSPSKYKGADWWREYNDENFIPQAAKNRNVKLALGHVRLAIIDLSSAAHQPMSSPDRNIWLVYNGEIYNFKELRQYLIARGHTFISQSDTEVLLHLYMQEGPAMVEKLNGIFAFALWDNNKKVLMLARDRYGVKPLYYAIVNDTLLFASEIKSILMYGSLHAEINLHTLSEYFAFQNTFGASTLFKGVNLVKPGHFLLIKEKTDNQYQIEEHKYWEFNFSEEENRGEDYYIKRLSEIVDSAVKRQLVSDVPLGIYLSGGMDSGTITAVACQHIPRLMTFTSGFDMSHVSGFEVTFDEREDAEILSSYLGTEHYQMVMHAGDLEWALPKVLWHIEELRVGMCYPSYYIARLASKFVKVVLSGIGGDELMAGYPWRYRHILNQWNGEEFNRQYFRYWNRLISEPEKRSFFSPQVWKEVKNQSSYDIFISVLGDKKFSHPLKKALNFEAKTFLHGILVIEDKLTMAHSLEARVPLLDNELVDFAQNIPIHYLLNFNLLNQDKSQQDNVAGKIVFKRAMEKLLPKSIIRKPKQGFSAPDRSWYKGKLMDYIMSLLLDNRTLDRGFFQPSYIKKAINEHMSGKINHRLLIWSLMSFEWWCRIFLDNKLSNKPPQGNNL